MKRSAVWLSAAALALMTLAATASADAPTPAPTAESGTPAPALSPTPGPVLIGDSILGDDFVLEIQTEATPTPAPQEIVVPLYGDLPRPGETPRISSLNIRTQAKLIFDSPFEPSRADLYNPADSTMIMVYQLRISLAELQRQTGMTGYSQEQYAQMSAQPGFDPEKSYVVLSQSKGVMPGDRVQYITLGTLPDGSTLPAGEYTGELLMVPFDQETMESAMVDATVMMPFEVKTSVIRLTPDEDYRVRLSVFNQTDSGFDVVYSIQLSQAEILRVTGSAHQSEENLALQAADADFRSEYEFVSLFDSEPIAPGAFLEEAILEALPDGEPLPSGTYTGWLVRYAQSDATTGRTMLDTDTQIQIVVP